MYSVYSDSLAEIILSKAALLRNYIMEVVKDIDFPKSLLINERNKFFNRVEDTVKK